MELPYSNLQLKHWNPGAENPLILPVHVICNTSDEQLHENIRTNSRRPGKWVRQEPEHNGVAVLCGSGPSLADCLDDIRAKRAAGAKIFAMNGAARFLAYNDIMPDYQVMIDARPETAQLVGPAKQHLIASQCHPDTFAKVPNAIVWHLQIEGIEDLFPPEYTGAYCLIGGAASVGNTATCLAYALGYRNLQIYGYDSSHRDGTGHAFSQPMNDGEPCAHVTFGGKDYVCSLTMKLQAEKFQETAKALREMGTHIEVHGSGLLPDMYNAPKEKLTEYEKYERMWAFPEYRSVAPGEICAQTFLDVAKPSGKVIDFGCGTGRGALKLHEAGLDVLLLDFTDNSRDLQAMGLPFLQHDLTKPIPAKADYGYCTDVMEHIPPGDVARVVQNVTDAAPVVFFQISTIPDQMGAAIGQDLHLTVRPHEWWRAFLQTYGEVLWEQEQSIASLFLIRRKDV
jgi:uncharacterized Rossmann fold enzyme